MGAAIVPVVNPNRARDAFHQMAAIVPVVNPKRARDADEDEKQHSGTQPRPRLDPALALLERDMAQWHLTTAEIAPFLGDNLALADIATKYVHHERVTVCLHGRTTHGRPPRAWRTISVTISCGPRGCDVVFGAAPVPPDGPRPGCEEVVWKCDNVAIHMDSDARVMFCQHDASVVSALTLDFAERPGAAGAPCVVWERGRGVIYSTEFLLWNEAPADEARFRETNPAYCTSFMPITAKEIGALLRDESKPLEQWTGLTFRQRLRLPGGPMSRRFLSALRPLILGPGNLRLPPTIAVHDCWKFRHAMGMAAPMLLWELRLHPVTAHMRQMLTIATCENGRDPKTPSGRVEETYLMHNAAFDQRGGYLTFSAHLERMVLKPADELLLPEKVELSREQERTSRRPPDPLAARSPLQQFEGRHIPIEALERVKQPRNYHALTRISMGIALDNPPTYYLMFFPDGEAARVPIELDAFDALFWMCTNCADSVFNPP